MHSSREQRVRCDGISTLNSSPSQRQPAHTTKTHSGTCQAHTPQPTEKSLANRLLYAQVSAKGGEALRCGSPKHTLRPSFPALSMRLVAIHSVTKQTMNSQTNKRAQRRTLNVQNQDMHMFSFPLSVSREASPLRENKVKRSVRGYITSVHNRQRRKRKSWNENACSQSVRGSLWW